jgi:hypothetical protein
MLITITHHEPKLEQVGCKDEFDNRCKDTYQGGNCSVDHRNLSKEPMLTIVSNLDNYKKKKKIEFVTYKLIKSTIH